MVLTLIKTVSCFSHNQNPREASSRSRIFIYSLVNVSHCGVFTGRKFPTYVRLLFKFSYCYDVIV